MASTEEISIDGKYVGTRVNTKLYMPESTHAEGHHKAYFEQFWTDDLNREGGRSIFTSYAEARNRAISIAKEKCEQAEKELSDWRTRLASLKK